MNEPKIRLIALCVFERDGRILVMEGHDPVKGESFYRPLGGGIEFGERGDETVVRELAEEIGAAVEEAWYLVTIENIFQFLGKPTHEVALIYDGRFADESLYQRTVIDGMEDDGEPIRAVWKSLTEFGPERDLLYPAGLLEQLTAIHNGNRENNA